MNIDTDHMCADEVRVARLIGGIEMLADRADDDSVDFGCRDSANYSGTMGPAMEERRGDIIPIRDAPLAGMARAHPIAAVIEDATYEQGLGLGAQGFVVVPLRVELCLDGVE